MTDNVEVPITVVQQQVNVPITPDAPNVIREGANEPSAKVSQMLAALQADLATTDLVMVSRPDTWTKKTTLAVLASFLSQAAIGAALLQEDAEGLPKKISDLAAASALSDEDTVALVQQGDTVKARMLDIANYMKTVVGSGDVFMPVGLHYGANVTTVQAAQNTAIIQALHDQLSPDFGGKGGALFIPGVVKFGGLQRHPAVGLLGDGRGSTKWICADNCPYVVGTRRVAGVVTPGANGEQRAMIYGLARAPFVPGQALPTQATEAWFSLIGNATLSGNKGAQSNNWVAAIYDEAGSSDPNYQDVSGQGQEAKAYSGMYCENLEVENFSGTGFYCGGDRQRAYWHVCRSLNHGIVTNGTVVTTARGWDIKGNDSIIGPRCGGGGSTDIAVVFSGPSGASISQGNFWGGNDYASNAATAVKARGCNGIFFVGNTWNANVCLDHGDGSATNRAVVVVGNRTQYDRTLFPVNTGEPLGLEAPNRNAAYTVIGYKQVCVRANTVTAASQTNRTMLHLLWASEGACVGAQFDYNSAAGVKPFAAADAIMADGGAIVTAELTDVGTGRRYTTGGTHSGESGGYHLVSGAFGLRRGIYAVTSGTPVQLGGEPTARLHAASGSVVDVLSLLVPAPRMDGQRVEVLFRSQVNNLTLALPVGLQDRPSDGAALQNVVLDATAAPAAVQAGTTLLLQYDRGTTTWSCAGVWNRYDPPNIKDPVRDAGAVFDGVTLQTAKLQASLDAAKQLPPGAFTYGGGGTMRLQVGVALTGPLTCSRTVSILGADTLGGSVLRSDFTSRAGVPGEDALISMLDDGIQQAGIVVQQSLRNFAIDGRRSTLSGGMATHVRHGILHPQPVSGSDRVASAYNLHAMNCSGAGWKIVENDQVRGSNVKVTGSKWGFHWTKVKDGKIDQVGLGSNDSGNKFIDCASVKIGTIDAWTGPTSDGSPVLSVESCAKFVVDRGEVEGMLQVIGDNDNSSSKSYRQVLMNEFNLINFKVSEDLFAAAGPGNVATGAGYVAHVKIVDAFGVRLPECGFGYKLGASPTAGQLAATPPVAIWFGTKVAGTDPQYDDYLEACGYVDVSTTTFLWHDGKASPGLRSKPIVAFKEHVSNFPERLHGYRVGTIHERPAGVPIPTDEVLCDGATYTSDYYPLLYLALGAGRKLTDRDAAGPGSDPVTGYVTFTVPNITARAGTVVTMVYKQ